MRGNSLLSFVFSLLFLLGCTQSPKQDTGSAPVVFDPFSPIPTRIDVEVPKIPGGDPGPTQDELISANTKKPIVYGVGAAGISFGTTLAESRTLMSRPFYGPDSDGLAAYRSGIYVFWNSQVPRRPSLMLLLGDYEGSMDLGPFGQVSIPMDMTALLGEDLEGKTLLKALYNHLEKIEDPQFDCLAARVCSHEVSDDSIILSWHKLALLISKDDKTLYRMALSNDVPKGRLDNDFDLTTGEILVSEQERVAIGQKWGDIKGRTGVDAPARMATQVYFKNFAGIALGISRTDVQAPEPSDEESLELLAVYNGFTQKLRIDGKLIKVVSGDPVKLELVDVAAEGDKTLDLRPQIAPNQQLAFIEALTDLLKQSLEAKIAGGTTVVFKDGFHKEKVEDREYSVNILRHNVETGVGQSVVFEVRARTGNIGFVQVSRLRDPSLAVSLPGIINTASPQGAAPLGGIPLGAQLGLDSVNALRQEGDLLLPGGVRTRVSLVLNTVIERLGPDRQPVLESTHLLRMPEVGVTYGFRVVGQDPSGVNIIQLTSAHTGSQVGGITGLCGNNDAVVKPGMTYSQVLGLVDLQLQGCLSVKQRDQNNPGLISAIHFPEQQISLNLSDGELGTISQFAMTGGQ